MIPRIAGRQFTLAEMMKAVAVVAVLMAMSRTPDLGGLVCGALGLLVIAGGLYVLSRLPPRLRIALVLTIAALFLVGFVRSLRLESRVYASHHAEDLARRYAILAPRATDPRESARLLAESEKFRRVARALEREATWSGVVRFFRGIPPNAQDGRHFVLEFALNEAEAECEATARRMSVSFRNSRRW